MGVLERRKREFERREREILDAALALFDGDNWDKVTVAEIARRAEVGKGTVYKHFSSKEAIYASLALEFGRTLVGELQASDLDQPPAGLLRELITVSLRHHMAHREYVRVAQYCARHDFRQRLEPELREQFEQLDAAIWSLGHAVLQRGVEAGVFADRPLEHHQLALTAAFQGAISLAWDAECGAPHLSLDGDSFAAIITDFMLAGLSAAAARELAPPGRPAPVLDGPGRDDR